MGDLKERQESYIVDWVQTGRLQSEQSQGGNKHKQLTLTKV